MEEKTVRQHGQSHENFNLGTIRIKTEHTRQHKLIAQHKLDRETGKEQREKTVDNDG